MHQIEYSIYLDWFMSIGTCVNVPHFRLDFTTSSWHQLNRTSTLDRYSQLHQKHKRLETRLSPVHRSKTTN